MSVPKSFLMTRVVTSIGVVACAGCGKAPTAPGADSGGGGDAGFFDAGGTDAGWLDAGIDSGTPDSGALGTTQIVSTYPPRAGSRWYDDFQQFVVDGGVVQNFFVLATWAQLDHGDADGGAYDFSSLDAQIQPYAAAGKRAVVLVWLVNDQIGLGGTDDGYTPKYVLSPEWANNCCSAAQVDIAPCNDGGVPVVYEAPFVAAAKPFIRALMNHLQGNKAVFYVRVGFVDGGEDFPSCHWNWPDWDGGTTFLSYIQEMAQFVGSVQGDVVFTAGVTGGFASQTYPDIEVADFHQAGIGMGMEALSVADVLAYDAGLPCNENWCGWAQRYPSDFRYLQESTQQVGVPYLEALPLYVPFAKSFHINAVEIFWQDLMIAYDPNYPGYADAGAAYRQALEGP